MSTIAVETITNIDGAFTLRFPKDAILAVNYIGFSSREVKVANEHMMISLREDSDGNAYYYKGIKVGEI